MHADNWPGPDYDHGAARTTDPDTSHQAAAEVDVLVLYDKVLGELSKGGWTTDEMAIATGYPRDSISPRMKPLVEMGKVMDSGERRPNPRSGKRAIVWRLVEDADRQKVQEHKRKRGEERRRAEAMGRMLNSPNKAIRQLAESFMKQEESDK